MGREGDEYYYRIGTGKTESGLSRRTAREAEEEAWGRPAFGLATAWRICKSGRQSEGLSGRQEVVGKQANLCRGTLMRQRQQSGKDVRVR